MQDIEYPSERVNLSNPIQSSDDLCKICLDKGTTPLISVCKCTGSIKFLHEECLKNWILANENNSKEPSCELCRYKYQIIKTGSRRLKLKEGIRRNIHYCCALIIIIIVLAISSFIIGFTIIRELDFKDSPGFSCVFLAICLITVLIGIAILILCIQKVCCARDFEDMKILPLINITEGIRLE